MGLEYIKKSIEEMGSLPTIPNMISHIAKATEDFDDDYAFEKLYEIISHDQAIAERVLRIANSPFFGHSGQIDNIRQAIMFLGFENIRNIALSMSIFSFFSKKSKVKLTHFFKHTYEVGLIAARLAKQLGFISEGSSFLEGLLHDVGRLLFLTLKGMEYYKIFGKKNLLAKEVELFGCNHCEAGMLIAEYGNLPDNFKEVIYCHHNPMQAKEYKIESLVVAISEGIVCKIAPCLGCDSLVSEDELKEYLALTNIDDVIMEDLTKYYYSNSESLEFFYK